MGKANSWKNGPIEKCWILQFKWGRGTDVDTSDRRVLGGQWLIHQVFSPFSWTLSMIPPRWSCRLAKGKPAAGRWPPSYVLIILVLPNKATPANMSTVASSSRVLEEFENAWVSTECLHDSLCPVCLTFLFGTTKTNDEIPTGLDVYPSHRTH